MAEPWRCGDWHHQGDPEVYDRGCGGCRMRRLVEIDREDLRTAHDVKSGPCKCGAWH
jgi:hypothetical protein